MWYAAPHIVDVAADSRFFCYYLVMSMYEYALARIDRKGWDYVPDRPVFPKTTSR
jgi:hypothetical protein